MSHRRKAASTGSNRRQAIRLGHALRGALATRGDSRDFSGKGASSARRPKLMLSLATVTAVFAIAATAAFALQTHNAGAPFDGSQVPNGAFGALGGVAVDQSGGDVYVVDTSGSGVDSSGAVQRFESSGTYVSQLHGATTAAGSLSLSTDSHIAIDRSGTSSEGTAYVTDSNNNLVVAFDTETTGLETAFDTDGQLDGSATPAGSFSTPCGIAVDQSNGNVLVADQNSNRIWIFDSSGKYLDRIADSTLSGPCGLALTSANDLYVRNAFDGKVLRFNKVGANEYSFASTLYAPAEEPGASDVAVNPSDDHVYVDKGDRITHYDSGGSPIATFGQETLSQPQTLFESRGVAVDSSSGHVYASDGAELKTFGPLVTLPDATTSGVENVTGETARLKGTVDPAGGPEAECNFEFGIDQTYGSSAPCEPAGPYFAPEAVHADLTGLSPATEYHYRLHATSAEGETFGADKTFATDGPPLIVSFSASEVTSTTAKLVGEINPSGASATYRFEYTTEADFEAAGFANATAAPVPDRNIGSGNIAISVSELVVGLSPNTKYRLRVITTNSIGTTESEVKTIKTFALPQAPTQGQFPGEGFLPDGRAWEMVSPPEKNGADVMADSTHVRAAASEASNRPMAVSFASLGGFTDVRGAGVSFEYLSERTAEAGTNGWSTHAITPPQDSSSLLSTAQSLTATYFGDFSADLTKGVFRAWSPLTEAPNVANVMNLYLRNDLRSPGFGSYGLLTGAANPLVAMTNGNQKPAFGAASEDLSQLAIESRLNLTTDAAGTNPKLYKSDGADLQLVKALPGCPGGQSVTAAAPCSIVGLGAIAQTVPHRAVSADGSRLLFASPVNSAGSVSAAPAISNLYQLSDGGTQISAEDATVKINASERITPTSAASARYQIASRTGNRVFFTSPEQLTEEPVSGLGLYLWDRKGVDESQQVTVDATGGTFTLTASTFASVGKGNITSGSSTVKSVIGSFGQSQTISGSGIPPGTKVTATGTFSNTTNSTLTLSAPATATANGVSLSASLQATTAPLPFNATPKEVQDALEALPTIGAGNVTVSGGPGGAGGGAPYVITFSGALAGVNVEQITANATALTGGASTANVTTTLPVENLSVVASDAAGVIGASNDGHHLYFAASTQLVEGGPEVKERALFYWQDVQGPPGGTVSLVGRLSSGDLVSNLKGNAYVFRPQIARVTPDGRHLLFEVSDGNSLSLNIDHGHCDGNPNGVPSGKCSHAYLYRADKSTPLQPDLICVSCSPSNVPPRTSALLAIQDGQGGTTTDAHMNHPISDDGRYIFFSTGERLVPRDTNGQVDAYEYDTTTEEARLLSSGENSKPSYFLEASADGSDVFIITSERLSAWDVDENRDLYDARVGGGLPEPSLAPPSCQGDACQPPAISLNDPSPASSSFTAPQAGVNRKKRCKRGQRRVKTQRGITRCIKRKVGRAPKHKGRTAK
jgi:hypothetical protein